MGNTVADIHDLYSERYRRAMINQKSDKVWVTRDAKIIPIEEMTDSHLENTIKMLEENEKRLEEKREEEIYKQIREIGEADFIRFYI